MNDAQAKELCFALMKADTEKDVIAFLENVGYWNNRAAWRYYGDLENNYSQFGNQQSRPDYALIEKLVNSVDARLMNECLVRGIDPEGPSAPQTIREAIAQFFEENQTVVGAGLIREWTPNKRTEIARGITLVATGAKPEEGNPSLTISDCGEGQTPEMMPHTLLSLVKSNKLRIPFVQGKFNMGGTGVLKFCGRYNLQLIVSRRNPAILNGKLAHPFDSKWGFTIVRREAPEGNRRSSIFTYLAPCDMEDRAGQGGVLRFSADTMPIFPEGREAYARESEWGTLIKLYEYSAVGYSKTHILRKSGLMSRIDLLLPDAVLPIRLHECRRGYRGHEGSFETTLTGIGVRLEDDKAENLEFSSSCPMSVAGEQMTATIFAFKKDKAETYRKDEGIIFTLNGQTHGHFTKDFFRRKNVGLSYLADSILVVVDCSKFSGRAREDFTMNSRDRLSGGELRAEIETALEDMLKHHQGLRDLRERRRREEVESKLVDAKPLEDVLQSLLKHSPTLSALFLKGNRLSIPFKTTKARAQEQPFEGKQYPTYFKFKGKDYGTVLCRDCHINMRCRIPFEADAVDDYFSRGVDPGEFSLSIVSDGFRSPVESYSMNLQNGIANLNLQLPVNCLVGDELSFVAQVKDPTQINSFENSFVINVKDAAEHITRSKNGRTSHLKGEGNEQEMPSGIQLPNIIKVYKTPQAGAKSWEDMNPSFDKYSALCIKHAGNTDESNGNGNDHDIYDFYVNMDNIYLKTELKSNTEDMVELTQARFVYGLVLLGLALLHQDAQTKRLKAGSEEKDVEERNNEINIEDKVAEFTKAVAQVLLPMIDSLGTLDLESIAVTDASGEAT